MKVSFKANVSMLNQTINRRNVEATVRERMQKSSFEGDRETLISGVSKAVKILQNDPTKKYTYMIEPVFKDTVVVGVLNNKDKCGKLEPISVYPLDSLSNRISEFVGSAKSILSKIK